MSCYDRASLRPLVDQHVDVRMIFAYAERSVRLQSLLSAQDCRPFSSIILGPDAGRRLIRKIFVRRNV